MSNNSESRSRSRETGSENALLTTTTNAPTITEAGDVPAIFPRRHCGGATEFRRRRRDRQVYIAGCRRAHTPVVAQ
jgi:hypothetical protein